MQDQLQRQGSPENSIWIDNEDFTDWCSLDGDKPPPYCYTFSVEGPDSSTYGYLKEDAGVQDPHEGDVIIHCCMKEMTEWMRNLDQVECDDLGTTASLKMDTLANTLIHEYGCVISLAPLRISKTDGQVVIGTKLG
ncbi:hypothetical protein N7510_000596 [Penicillium lagena]|uniref:uncharacterized protein n=1 Tax=Penicillium lagena TaxID=94218 RepID=UPI002541BC6C|nr:uncharacterized protein N7510_000596 [Penicillium lagena]KAJ5624287.1 hypothetical protein N7510_000596 [Penicillium lagena]